MPTEVRRWGCFNRKPFHAALEVQTGWTPDGRRAMAPVPHVMTTDCQYSRHASDPKCSGCTWQHTPPATDQPTTP